MTTTAWIESAANPRKAPVGADKLHSNALLSMPKGRESEERKELRRAARYLIRKGNADRDLLLEALGLTYEQAAPLPSRPGVPEVTAEPAERTKRCTKCEVLKPLEAFPRRSNSSDRRISRCRQCRNDHSRAYRIAEKEAGR